MCSSVKVKLGRDGPSEETVGLGGRRSLLILCSPHSKPARDRAKGAGDTEPVRHLYSRVRDRFPVCAPLGGDRMRNWAGGASRYLAVVAALQL